MFKWFMLPLLATLPAPAPAQAPGPVPADEPFILAFGDSLTAGYGLGRGLGFAPQLEGALRRHGVKAHVHDAGVSGDTTSGGRARLGWTLDGLPRKPDLAIVELGANDMLRGVDPAVTRKAIEGIVERLKERGIPVMLAGMYASRNLGPDYGRRFDAIYKDIADKHGLVLYPFFLEGIVGDRAFNLPDGLHPTAKGVEAIVQRILPTVEAFLARLMTR